MIAANDNFLVVLLLLIASAAAGIVLLLLLLLRRGPAAAAVGRFRPSTLHAGVVVEEGVKMVETTREEIETGCFLLPKRKWEWTRREIAAS